MNPRAMRNWGLAFGGSALALALAIAAFTRDPALAPEPEQIPRAGRMPAAETQMATTPDPGALLSPLFSLGGGEEAETAPAEQDDPGAPLAFIVRFSEDHDMARAQALAAEGREASARRAAERALRRDRDLRGLCFDRFTVGGAEVVLRPCDPASLEQAEALRQEWAEKLAAMPSVAYAEANVVLRPEDEIAQ